MSVNVSNDRFKLFSIKLTNSPLSPVRIAATHSRKMWSPPESVPWRSTRRWQPKPRCRWGQTRSADGLRPLFLTFLSQENFMFPTEGPLPIRCGRLRFHLEARRQWIRGMERRTDIRRCRHRPTIPEFTPAIRFTPKIVKHRCFVMIWNRKKREFPSRLKFNNKLVCKTTLFHLLVFKTQMALSQTFPSQTQSSINSWYKHYVGPRRCPPAAAAVPERRRGEEVPQSLPVVAGRIAGAVDPQSGWWSGAAATTPALAGNSTGSSLACHRSGRSHSWDSTAWVGG